MALGTLTSLDPLKLFPGTVLDFGEDAALQAVNDTLNAYNDVVQDMFAGSIEETEEPIEGWGISVDTELMDELDEFGTSNPMKVGGGQNVGFPLRNYGKTLQWTKNYLANTSAKAFAVQVDGIITADLLTMYREFKRCIYLPTNYTFVDRWVTENKNLTISVKRLLNGDGASIPVGPNGETFNGASHSHYLGAATMTNAAVTAALEHVIEHYTDGSAQININRADESAFRLLTDFNAYPDPRVTYGANTQLGRGVLDNTKLYNRAIGVFRGAEVWVKPWAIANILHFTMKGAPAPVKRRKRKGSTGRLELVSDVDAHPLRARAWEHMYGFGVHERSNGVLLYIGNASYQAPTI
jgi:hypothetical protein